MTTTSASVGAEDLMSVKKDRVKPPSQSVESSVKKAVSPRQENQTIQVTSLTRHFGAPQRLVAGPLDFWTLGLWKGPFADLQRSCTNCVPPLHFAFCIPARQVNNKTIDMSEYEIV